MLEVAAEHEKDAFDGGAAASRASSFGTQAHAVGSEGSLRGPEGMRAAAHASAAPPASHGLAASAVRCMGYLMLIAADAVRDSECASEAGSQPGMLLLAQMLASLMSSCQRCRRACGRSRRSSSSSSAEAQAGGADAAREQLASMQWAMCCMLRMLFRLAAHHSLHEPMWDAGFVPLLLAIALEEEWAHADMQLQAMQVGESYVTAPLPQWVLQSYVGA